MTTKDKLWSVPLRITIPGKNRDDAIKQANEAVADGLIEPGFVEDGAVVESDDFMDASIFELEPAEE